MESSLVVQSFLALGVIILVAQLMGAAARALGQPRVFGELLAGVLLGPTLLDLMHWAMFDNTAVLHGTIEEFAELGVLFLMFTVGLEVHLRELFSVGKVALWGGTIGALLPVAMTLPVVLAFDYPTESALFAGVVLAATSVSISAQTLLELGILRTKEGLGLLATAVVDDVLAILLLSVVIATLGSSGGVANDASFEDLVWIIARMVLYLGGALAIAWLVLPRLFNWVYHTRPIAGSTTSFALIAALLFGWAADELGGVAAITGAFIAGVGLSQTNERAKAEIENTVRQVSYAFLVPIFFVNVGLNADLSSIGADMLPLAGLLLLVAIVAKIAGSAGGARMGGFTRGEAFRLGVCMVSRGEVGLIIAALGLSSGLLDDALFEPLFLVILLTTVLTPPAVRLVFRGQRPAALYSAKPRTARPNAER